MMKNIKWEKYSQSERDLLYEEGRAQLQSLEEGKRVLTTKAGFLLTGVSVLLLSARDQTVMEVGWPLAVMLGACLLSFGFSLMTVWSATWLIGPKLEKLQSISEANGEHAKLWAAQALSDAIEKNRRSLLRKSLWQTGASISLGVAVVLRAALLFGL